MEQRKNNFTSLLLYSLKNKKNWFLLSTVIVLITTILIPFILGIKDTFFIMLGIIEVFVLVFVNCLVDNSFLHNDSKLTYYKSKPFSFRNQIFINIINNHVLTGFLLLLILLSAVVQNNGINDIDVFEIYKVVIPWLSVGIFLSALSSILSGNTVAAGLMTIFNFALPGIFYLIIYFVFSILEDLVIGFSARVLMEYFVDVFYKLEYIYFVVYSYSKTIDVLYFVILGSIIVFITFLIIKMVKKRKNENTGSFMVFDGYKYFVAVLASLIIPAFFAVETYGSVASKMIVVLLLITLSYYIIIAIMEKAFRISKLSIKVFLVSMAAFIVLTVTTVLIATPYKNTVPNPEDVKAAYIGNNRWQHTEISRIIKHEGGLSDEKLSEIETYYRNRDIILFTDKENIESITRMHKEFLNNQSYDGQDVYMNSMVINYYMNDGSTLVRDYSIKNYDSTGNARKDEIAAGILKSKELKDKRFFYLYDENFYQRNKDIIKLRLRNDNGVYSPDDHINVDQIRPYLIKDIDEMFKNNSDRAFAALNNYNFELPRYKETHYIEVSIINEANSPKEFYQTFYLDDRFANTKEFLGIE